MERPEITIVTAVYNGKCFIECCLQSVIDQNFPAVEHLVIDGGSTDGTAEIIKAYAGRYPHIRWLSEKDNGQSAALNKGIRMSRAPVIGILNCDDFYSPGVFSRAAAIFKSAGNPSFVVANCNVLNEKGQIIHYNRPANLNIADLLIGGSRNEFPWNPSSYFYHKELHERVGYYDERDHQCMDLDFILKAVQAADCRYVDETWGNFRLIPGTKTYEAIRQRRLQDHVQPVLQAHFKRLPFLQRCRIRILRALFVTKKLQYYAGRLAAYLKNPGEIFLFFSRRLENLDKGRFWQQLDFYCMGRKSPEFLWKSHSPCPTKKAEGCLVSFGRFAYSVGGFISIDHTSRHVHVLDLDSGRWVDVLDMPLEMADTHLGAIGDGQRYIYFVSGQLGPQCHPATPNCFVLDTKDRKYSRQLPALPEARYACALQLWNGRLHVMGGSKPDRNTPCADHFSIAVADGKALEAQWQQERPIPRGGPHRASAVIDGKLYLLGGEEGDVKAVKDDPGYKCDWATPFEHVYGDSYVLHEREGTWQPLPSMAFPVSHTEYSTVIIGHLILLAGGNHGRRELSDKVQVFDTKANCWKTVGKLPYPMKTGAVSYRGQLYLINGQRSKNSHDPAPGRVLNSVWCADLKLP